MVWEWGYFLKTCILFTWAFNCSILVFCSWVCGDMLPFPPSLSLSSSVSLGALDKCSEVRPCSASLHTHTVTHRHQYIKMKTCIYRLLLTFDLCSWPVPVAVFSCLISPLSNVQPDKLKLKFLTTYTSPTQTPLHHFPTRHSLPTSHTHLPLSPLPTLTFLSPHSPHSPPSPPTPHTHLPLLPLLTPTSLSPHFSHPPPSPPTPYTHLPLQSPVGLSQSLHLSCPPAPQRCNIHLLPLSHSHTITQCFILLSQLVQLTLQDIHPLSQFSYVPENVRARHISIWSRSFFVCVTVSMLKLKVVLLSILIFRHQRTLMKRMWAPLWQIWCFRNVTTHNRIVSNFYPGLPHIHTREVMEPWVTSMCPNSRTNDYQG